jgi:hypothetical protein
VAGFRDKRDVAGHNLGDNEREEVTDLHLWPQFDVLTVKLAAVALSPNT